MKYSDDNASTWETGNLKSNSIVQFNTTVSYLSSGTGYNNFIGLNRGTIGSIAGTYLCSIVDIFTYGSGYPYFTWKSNYQRNDNYFEQFIGGGKWHNSNNITNIKVYMSCGNIASGEFKLYGIK
jgi:hypothetical protein